MKDVTQRVNGDLVEPAVKGIRAGMDEIAALIRDHPDEVAVFLAPAVVLTLATARGAGGIVSSFAVTEVGVICGALLMEKYKSWKAQPVRSVLKVA